jgi:hypothetical protein
MNTGLQDAANLGWKLAAAVRGHAPAGLLDTYHAERHPVGRLVVRNSGALIRLVMIQSRPGRAVRNTLGGAVLQIGPLARKVSGMLSGIGIGYPAPSGAHHLVGKRAGDTLLAGEGAGPTRLYEALRGGGFLLLTPSNQDTAVPPKWSDRVRRAGVAEASDTTVLVRPDGYVAWASEKPGTAAVEAALTDWCGE